MRKPALSYSRFVLMRVSHYKPKNSRSPYKAAKQAGDGLCCYNTTQSAGVVEAPIA